MSHRPMPAYRAARRLWYVEIEGRQIPLGHHPEGAEEPRKSGTRGGARGHWQPPPEVVRAFHRLMAEMGRDDPSPAEGVPGEAPQPLAAEVLDEFLTWLKAQPHKAERTVDWYGDYLQSFLDSLPDQSVAAGKLTPRHVQRWLDAHPGWATGRRGAIVAVQRAFNWSAKEGLLRAAGLPSPLIGMEKPPQGKREQVISEEEFAAILANVRPDFRDLLVTAWETGARPQELFTVEAGHFEEASSRWVFPVRLSKGRKSRRVVYLSEKALAVTRRLCGERKSGPLFLNSDGSPWCQSSVKCRFQRLRGRMGEARAKALGLLPPKIKRLTDAEKAVPGKVEDHRARRRERAGAVKRLAKEHGVMYPLYAFRHSFCTEMLVKGEDAVTVSVLMGHKDTTMISRHYSHLTNMPEHLKRAVNRRAAGDASD